MISVICIIPFYCQNAFQLRNHLETKHAVQNKPSFKSTQRFKGLRTTEIEQGKNDMDMDQLELTEAADIIDIIQEYQSSQNDKQE